MAPQFTATIGLVEKGGETTRPPRENPRTDLALSLEKPTIEDLDADYRRGLDSFGYNATTR